MKDLLELKEFFVEGGNQDLSHVLLHITEPSTASERLKGYFFALVEVSKGTKKSIAKIQKTIDEIEQTYYELPPHESKNKDLFELAIEKINKTGHKITEGEGTNHCVMGVVRGDKISFVYHGKPSVLLLYKQKKQLHVLDILEEGKKENDKEQLFSSLLEGSIREGDFFYVGTPHITKYFPHKKIEQTIGSRSIEKAVEYIQKTLHNERSEYSYGGIIFKVKSTKIKDTKEKDKKLVMPLKKQEPVIAKKENKKIKQNLSTRKPKNSNDPFALQTAKAIGEILLKGLITLLKLILLIIKFIGRTFANLFLIITNRGNNRSTVIDGYYHWWGHKRDALKSLPLLSKILLALTFLFALIFIISVITVTAKENKKIEQQKYVQLVQSIKDKKDAAEGSLIYNDNERALALLEEAKTLIKKLPENDTKRSSLNEGIDENINKIKRQQQKFKNVSSKVIAYLGPQANVSNLVMIKDTLVAYGPDDTTHYQIDKDTGSVKTQDHNSLPNLKEANTPKEEDSIIFLAGEDSIASYDKENGNISSLEISFPKDEANIATLFVYNQKLYTIDKKNNKIYKHSKTQTGFGRGDVWNKTAVDFDQAISMAIDGDMYVLMQSGEIKKFTSGNAGNFSHEIEPALENATKIWTYNGVEEIYIVEPTNKRIIKLNKEGKLLAQYTSEEWQGPTDFVIQNDDGIIYVLDSNKIYSFEI